MSVFRNIIIAGCGLLLASPASAQVLGACGTRAAQKPARKLSAQKAHSARLPRVTRVPLPGEQAPNFVLPAVVGQTIKQIKLSDYDGKWRVVCFYPADFTFV